MLDKLNNALETTTSTSSEHDLYFDDKGNQIDEKNIEEIEQEYNRLVPEYNQLIDYLEKVSQKFSRFQQDFHFEQTNEKATKIVEEFFQCEQSEAFLEKRQRAMKLNRKLEFYKSLIEKHSIQSDWDQLDISDDEEDQHQHIDDQ